VNVFLKLSLWMAAAGVCLWVVRLIFRIRRQRKNTLKESDLPADALLGDCAPSDHHADGWIDYSDIDQH
jgi:hypothetical protein